MEDPNAKKQSLKTLLSQLKGWKKDDVKKKFGKKQQQPSAQVQVQVGQDQSEQQDDVVKKLIARLLKE